MKTAIDVVLLPSPEMTAKAIQINRRLLKFDDKKIVLNEQNCLPHISLCMGVVENVNLPQIQAILSGISRDFSPHQLVVENMQANIMPTGKKVADLRIEDDVSLRRLQATIMDKLWSYLTYDVDAQMFYNPQEVEEITFNWIRDFAKLREDSSLFHPHITVGIGETEVFNEEFPMTFAASTLSLCQLGNYCTARKVLGDFKLSAS